MNTQIYTRLSWQIPVLVILVVLLTPDFSWVSSAIGAWPVWLLSLPFAALVRHVVTNRVSKAASHRMKSAQVFVFQNASPPYHCIRESQKRAA